MMNLFKNKLTRSFIIDGDKWKCKYFFLKYALRITFTKKKNPPYDNEKPSIVC